MKERKLQQEITRDLLLHFLHTFALFATGILNYMNVHHMNVSHILSNSHLLTDWCTFMSKREN